jgi:hypothetical protein
MIFYGFSKFQSNCNTIEESVLHEGPREFLSPYRYTIGLQIGPQKDLRPRNWVLGQRAVLPARIRRGRRRSWPGK